MSKFKTHYDNLKIQKTAPIEVVRAAYRGLSQKYHPDRNQNDPEAGRIMVLINQAYETLSDPVKRQKHDIWIEEQEAQQEQKAQPQQKAQQEQKTQPQQKDSDSSILTKFLFIIKFSLAGIIVLSILYRGGPTCLNN